VVDVGDHEFLADISAETLRRTNLEGHKVGDEVNLERSLRLDSRLGGHIVTGHVDGQGQVVDVVRSAGSVMLGIEVSRELSQYIVEKGSVAVNGISLTVSGLSGRRFEVTMVPYTVKTTTMARTRVGDYVNIETDIIGKYVRQFVGTSSPIDQAFLADHGFL
jgi:riboflavin synthase